MSPQYLIVGKNKYKKDHDSVMYFLINIDKYYYLSLILYNIPYYYRIY